jgi:D-amino-acid dehydrogenase
LETEHTIVVGGGIVGVSVAYYLAKRGHRVSLIERGDIGRGASFGNAGIIAFGHPPIPRPGLVKQTLKWMLDSGSPLYIPPRFDPAMFRWFWEFRRACTEEHFRACMNVLGALGREAMVCFDGIMGDESMTCEYHRNGWREVFYTPEGLAGGRLEADLLRRHGFEVEILDGPELMRREPAFVEGAVGAVQFVESTFTDPYQFLLELTDRARDHGAVVRPNTEVMDVILRGDRFTGVRLDTGENLEGDTLVLAAGIWSTGLAKRIGLNIPMQAGKGYHRDITRPTPCLKVATVLAERHVAVTPIGDVLRLAGTVEFSGINDRLIQKRLDMLTTAARKYLRGIGQTQTVSEWCGLRPCTADGLPVVGWAPRPEGVFVATGHARMGLTLGPITGRLVSECILDGEPSVDISPLRADRFDARGRITPDGPQDLDTAARATET